MTPSLDIVIVNWNSGSDLARCLHSIAGTRHNNFELGQVVVVDNGSTDGSAKQASSQALPVTVIRNEANRGFSAACNQGAVAGEGDYLLFLNTDTLLDAGALDVMIGFMQANPRVGILGPRMEYEDGSLALSCARFPTAGALVAQSMGLDRVAPGHFRPHFLSAAEHAVRREVDQVMGACFLVRRILWTQLGGFDERFFVFYEELDFSVRAAQAGWTTVYLPGARVVHVGGWRSGAHSWRLALSMESRIAYARKHFGMAWLAVAAATLLVEPFARFIRALMSASFRSALDTAGAYAILWGRMFRRPERQRA